MKKMMILLLGVLLILPVFGATLDTTSLVLESVVTGVAEIKISDTSATTVSEYNSATEITSVSFSEGNLESGTLYFLVKTNKSLAMTIEIAPSHLISTGLDTVIAYDILSGGVVKASSSDAPVSTVIASLPADTSSGLKVTATDFEIKLLSDINGVTLNSFQRAIEGTYTTTLAIELKTP